ncbi:MAG: 30S ribosomal protein S17 [Gammaproteobacteria bacterium]|nr:30S ribosomal protein S17 [Gammaproteobacteria bacterium]
MSEQMKATRSITGRVISNKMDKTITVMVERRQPHPVYKKYVRSSSKLHAHDENNECREGDMVIIEQSRPLSKTKAWRLVKVVGRAD